MGPLGRTYYERVPRLHRPSALAGLLLLGLLAAAGILAAAGLGWGRVEGDSMWPALRPGAWVVYARWLPPSPGRVVVARVGGREVVKRVVAGPGQVVRWGGGWLEVDGRAVARVGGRGADASGGWFLLGDNAGSSWDSRAWGRVERSQIQGVVIWSR